MTTAAERKNSWFGRDPVTLLNSINAGLLALIAVFVTNNVWAGAVGGVVTMITALIAAFVIKRDGQLAAIIGLAKALIAVAVLAGAHWDTAYQVILLAAVEAVAGIFVRDRVDPPVPAAAATRDLRSAA